MKSKVPNLSSNIGATSGYGESAQYGDADSSDYDETNEYSSENEMTTNDFSEYVWMGEEEEFENQVLQSLEEQELINDCMEMHEAVNEVRKLQGAEIHNSQGINSPELKIIFFSLSYLTKLNKLKKKLSMFLLFPYKFI